MRDINDIEGSIARNLFRTDSDSDSDNGDNNEAKRNSTEQQQQDEADETTTATVLVRRRRRRKVLHVWIEEMQVGASIAERLWPAAEFLANFILNVASSELILHQDDVHEATRHLQAMLQQHQEQSDDSNNMDDAVLSVVELGAGVGLTGLALATRLPVKVLLTDLPAGLPLLHTNCELNRNEFRLGMDSVQVQTLEWGNEQDAVLALEWSERTAKAQSTSSSPQPTPPLLCIGSDCVYWEELHEPLERTIYHLLSAAPLGSMCLLAGMRRWKRDNSFYQSLGKRTRTTTHELRCVCVKETVTRTPSSTTYTSAGAVEREIMRVYAIQWVERQKRKSKQNKQARNNTQHS